MPKDTPLHKAAHQGDVNACKELVESGEIGVNEPGAQDRTALQRAVGGNHLECAKVLTELGADVNQCDKSGRAPLHWAAIGGHAECVKFLLEKKVNPNIQTKSGMSPLHAAVDGNRVEVVKIFIEYNQKIKEGAVQGDPVDFELKDGDQKTAFEIAKGKKLADVVKVLKEGAGAGGDKSEACTVM